MLSKEIIEEFRLAAKEEYSCDFSFEQASIILKNLTGYFHLMAKLNYKNNSSEQSKCDAMHDKNNNE